MIEKTRELISNGEQFTGFVYDLDGSTDISSSQWISEIELFNETYLKKHPLHNRIQRLCFHKKTDKTCSELLGVLRTLEKDFSTTLATETESELIEENELPPIFVPTTMLVQNLPLSGNRSGA